jgi:hypothetical protein
MAKRGGKRVGAGRPKRALTQAKAIFASNLLTKDVEEGVWRELFSSKDQGIKLESIKYLTDRRDGRPKLADSDNGQTRILVLRTNEVRPTRAAAPTQPEWISAIPVLSPWDYKRTCVAKRRVAAAFIEPMLRMRKEKLPEGAEWLYEPNLMATALWPSRRSESPVALAQR